MLLIIAGFLGGAFRGLVSFVNYKGRKVELSYLLSVILTEGFIGMMLSLAVFYSGLITMPTYLLQLVAVFFTAYVCADLSNSIYKILHKKMIV